MLTEHQYWMFGNGLLLVLDIEALIILGLHLWYRRKEFTFPKHGVSLAFFIYILGHMIFRTIAWEMWREVGTTHDLQTVTIRVLWLFSLPVLKASSLLNIVGLIMIMAVLTWNVRYLWIVATTAAIALAFAASLVA